MNETLNRVERENRAGRVGLAFGGVVGLAFGAVVTSGLFATCGWLGLLAAVPMGLFCGFVAADAFYRRAVR